MESYKAGDIIMRIEFFDPPTSPRLQPLVTSSVPIKDSFVDILKRILEIEDPVGEILRKAIFEEIIKEPFAKHAYGFRFCTYQFKLRKADNAIVAGRPIKESPTYFIGGEVMNSNQAKKRFPDEFATYRKYIANCRPYNKPVIVCRTGNIESFNHGDIVLNLDN